MAKLVLLLALFIAYANASCYVSGGSQSLTTGEIGTAVVCSSLDSDCIHPDSTYFAANGCGGKTITQCCSGGGQDPSRAASNRLSCVFSLANGAFDASDCPGRGSYSVSTEQNVILYYTPCYRYTGAVRVQCTSIYGNDDYSGSGPGTAISTANITFNYNPRACTTCLAGTCDSVLGCLCPPGKFGDNCELASGSSLVYSAAVIMAALMVSIFAAL